MCDLNKINACIIAAQLAALVAVGSLFTAMVGKQSLFAIFTSTGPMIVAAVFIGIALIALGVALSSMPGCITGACRGPGSALLAMLSLVFAALGATLAGIIVATFSSAVPFLGAGSIALLFWGLSGLVLLWPSLAGALLSLSNCLNASPSVPTFILILG